MSEVHRWKLKGFIPGVEGGCKAVFQPTVVLAEHYDQAQSQLAALREELARVKEQSATRLGGLADCGIKREAAERRNADLIESLSELRDIAHTKGGTSLAVFIDAALTKPEEATSRPEPPDLGNTFYCSDIEPINVGPAILSPAQKAAPVVERQEPVAWAERSPDWGFWEDSFRQSAFEGGVPLYESPPAPVAVGLSTVIPSDTVLMALLERFADYAEGGKVAEPSMVEELREYLDGIVADREEP